MGIVATVSKVISRSDVSLTASMEVYAAILWVRCWLLAHFVLDASQ